MRCTDDVRYWHKADIDVAADVRYSGVKRTCADWQLMSANDPKRTSACISCCGSEVGFQHYQSTRLSRYDALSGGWRSYEAAEFITLIGGAGAVNQTLVQGFLSN